MMKTLFLLLLVSCTDDAKATRILRDQGYTNIEITGYRWGACGREDHYCTGFDAKSPAGHDVSGAVGCGLGFKGCTIRLD